EHHLQRAISAQQAFGHTGELVIPTPEVYTIGDDVFDAFYPPNYKLSRQLIHMQPFAMDQDIPDYDMDSEDEKWLNQQAKKMEIHHNQFEEMMDRLEKGSGQQIQRVAPRSTPRTSYSRFRRGGGDGRFPARNEPVVFDGVAAAFGEVPAAALFKDAISCTGERAGDEAEKKVVTLNEAKTLLKEDDDLIIAVYDYWLNKRLRTQCPLVPQVKSEKRDGSNNSNPYVAFRRRTEKMQTRKNRKNDEASYEKMLKLRRDLSRAVTLLEMVKRREKTKREHLHLTIEVFEKRYQVGDFSGQIMAEVLAMKNSRPSYVSVNNSQLSRQESRLSKHRSEDGVPRKKREYTKRRNKEIPSLSQSQVSYTRSEVELGLSDMPSSDDEPLSPVTSPSDNEDENDPDGPYAFRRKKYCNYHAPLLERLGNYPWCGPEEGGAGDRKYRYCLTTLAVPKPHCVGFARRRIGRGGRILLDRAWTPLEDYWPDLDIALNQSMPNGLPPSNDFLAEIKNDWLHFRPQQRNNAGGPGGPGCSGGGGGPTSSTPTTSASTEHRHDASSGTQAENPPPPASGALSSGTSSTTDFESFQSHQEELFEMQRKQLERLKGGGASGGGGNASAGGTSSEGASSGGVSSSGTLSAGQAGRSGGSHLTLDPASVEFAVSAVMSTTEMSGMILNSLVSSSSSSLCTAQGDHMVARLSSSAASNGPSADGRAAEADVSRAGRRLPMGPGGDPGTEADSCVAALVPPVELGTKLPASLADLRFPILEQNGNEGNK
ncbi:hypothetical protein HPB47_001837, partial [Ixodes persulcatus]